MAICSCNGKRDCTLAAVVISAIIGIVAAFLQISGAITVTPVFLWVVFGIAVVYLGVLTLVSTGLRRPERPRCLCSALNAVLAGILGTVLLALVLLAIGIVATSVLSAVLAGLLLASFALVLTSSACLVRCLADCEI